MPKDQKEKGVEEGKVADKIVGAINKVIPGFGSFFKKGEQSKRFGARMKEIRNEINKRFKGKV